MTTRTSAPSMLVQPVLAERPTITGKNAGAVDR